MWNTLLSERQSRHVEVQCYLSKPLEIHFFIVTSYVVHVSLFNVANTVTDAIMSLNRRLSGLPTSSRWKDAVVLYSQSSENAMENDVTPSASGNHVRSEYPGPRKCNRKEPRARVSVGSCPEPSRQVRPRLAAHQSFGIAPVPPPLSTTTLGSLRQWRAKP